MKPEARIETAREIFALAFGQKNPADRIITAELRNRRYIGSSDRREITSLIWNAFRNLAKISFLLNAKNLPATAENIFTESMYQFAENDFPESVKLECPEWLWEDLKNKSDDLKAMQNQAFTDLRVNVTKTNCNNVTDMFAKEGIQANQCNISPLGVRLLKRCNLQACQAYKNGLAEVQDEGSQIISLLIDAKPENRIADLCAGGGGKTLAMYDLTAGKAKITACDIAFSRLKQLQVRAERAGFFGIDHKVLSTDYEPWLSQNAESFDVVVVDAPCSGTGTWRRAPDAKWRLTREQINYYETTQQWILTKAPRLIKKGGRLLYITCSLRAEENEKQFTEFLKNHSDFRPAQNLAGRFKNVTGHDFSGISGDGFLYISPSVFSTDGFFFAEAIRTEK